MTDVKIECVDDPVKTKQLNYDCPIVVISTPHSCSIIPMNQLCYRELKRVVSNAYESIKEVEQ